MSKITDASRVRALFFFCWTAYFCSYLGRLNFSSATLDMVNAGLVTTAAAGLINTAYFTAYGIGSFVNGLAGDRLSPKTMIAAGLGLSGAANALMPIVAHTDFLSLVWAVNGWAQAMVWAPMLRMFALLLTDRDKISFSVDIVSSQVGGTLASLLLAAAASWLIGWEGVFAVPAVILLAAAAGWLFFFERFTGFQTPDFWKATSMSGTSSIKKVFSQVLLLSGCGIALLAWPAFVHGTLKDGLSAWTPTILGESFGLTASFALLVTAVLPIINFFGAYLAKAVLGLVKENVFVATALLLAAAALDLVTLSLWGMNSLLAAAFLIAFAAALTMGVNTLLVSIYPLRFEGRGTVSSVSGLLNALGYLGAAASTAASGASALIWGWKPTFLIWAGITATAAVVCLLGRTRKPKQ